jgi:hypothetical protein
MLFPSTSDRHTGDRAIEGDLYLEAFSFGLPPEPLLDPIDPIRRFVFVALGLLENVHVFVHSQPLTVFPSRAPFVIVNY